MLFQVVCFILPHNPCKLIVGTEWGWEQLQSRGLKHTEMA